MIKEIGKRIEFLSKLKKAIEDNLNEIFDALKSDFNKSAFDTYTTEVGLALEEIGVALKNIAKWTKPKKVRTSVKSFPSSGEIIPEPFGKVLIISPWNYPFMLSIVPLVGAVAAGNNVVLKPSTKTPKTFNIIKKLVELAQSGDNTEKVVEVTDSRDVLNERFDYIFFTGGVTAGRLVLESAAKWITPTTLELGGKSPCIIDKDANLELAAKRLAWGKFLNAGQTCVAPDYIMVHTDIFDEFVEKFIQQIRKQYFVNEQLSEDFPWLINEEKGAEMKKIIADSELLFGGKIEGRKMSPTVIAARMESLAMKSEIFAPLAPVLEFLELDKVVDYINRKEKPLAFYYFGGNTNIINRVSFGGGCINDVVMHVAEGALPFGGVGFSGMGSYHGKKSFDTFSHFKSVLTKGAVEIPVRYAPHSEKDLNFIKKIIR